MIDQNTITTGRASLLDSINLRRRLDKSLYHLTGVFDADILKKIKNYLDGRELPWESVAGQEKFNRKKISWQSDSVIEELHEIFMAATDCINTIFPEPKKNFWGISIWEDREGYAIDWHTDNPDIDVSIQVYLFGDGTLGTEFSLINENIVIPDVSNSGYLLNQSISESRLSHRTLRQVPPGRVRYSLYAVWSRYPKKSSNT